MSSENQKCTSANTGNAHARRSALGVLGGIGCAKGSAVAACHFFRKHALDVAVERGDPNVMHNPVKASRGGQTVLEDRVSLREKQVRGDHHTAALLPVGREGEGDLHSHARLHRAQVIQGEHPKPIEAEQGTDQAADELLRRHQAGSALSATLITAGPDAASGFHWPKDQPLLSPSIVARR